MKVPRTVKTKIAKLIKVFGKRKFVAERLGIHVTYIYKLERGKIPGKRLYRDICKFYDKNR